MSEPTTNVVTEIIQSNQKVEAPEANSAPQAKAPEQKDDKMSSRFAALARKEKAVREAEQKAKQEAEQYKPYQDLKARAKTNPLDVIKEYGLSLDDLIMASLPDAKPRELSVEEQIQALKDEMANDKKNQESERLKAEEEKAQAYQDSIDEAILNHKLSITEAISNNKDKYELIVLNEAEDLVWEVTEAFYEANRQILSPEDAADKVEAYLEEKTRKAMELQRFKSKGDVNPMQTFESIPVSRSENTKTLSGDMHVTPADKPSSRHLSDEESKKRAAALLRWN